MKIWNKLGAGLAVIALTVAAFGQGTTTPPATCTTPPTGLTALNVERAVPLANVLTTLTPNVPASTLAAVAGGALEIRDILIYNAQLGTVTETTFLVPAGSPLPTKNFDFATGVVQVATLSVREILFGCSPSPSMLIVGTLNVAGGPYGAATNLPAALSLGYTLDNPPKINNVAAVAAGVAVAWSASAVGTLTFPAAPTGGGTTPGTGPTIVVNTGPGTTSLPANSVVQATSSPFLLDASKSTGSGALTFAWSSTSNTPVAFVSTGVNGQILVQFPAAGDYGILLTVTDSSGAKATFPLTLTFVGRPQ